MDERRSADRVAGPADSQAAMAMGHTVAAWDAAYDKNYQRRECQAGVDAMSVWRQHMVSKSVSTLAISSTPALESNDSSRNAEISPGPSGLLLDYDSDE